MASKRKMVFGYRMEFGDIIPSPNEAETVQYIYATYLTGASFQHLAKELDKRDVPYDAGKHWNVNMVARILEDSRYIGTEVYPALISAEQFQAVQERRKQKRSIPSRTPAQAALYRLCGGTVPDSVARKVLKILNQGGRRSAAHQDRGIRCSRHRRYSAAPAGAGQASAYAARG